MCHPTVILGRRESSGTQVVPVPPIRMEVVALGPYKGRVRRPVLTGSAGSWGAAVGKHLRT